MKSIKPLPHPKRFSEKTLLLERRKTRSPGAADAMQRMLDAAAKRAKLQTLLVADAGGLVVCKSDGKLDVAMIAAVAPIVGQGRAKASIKCAGKPVDITVREIELEGESMYVTAVGGKFGDREREVAASVAAAHRILAA